MNVFRHWRLALLVFYLCLIAPAVFACDARLNLANPPTFKFKGNLGDPTAYPQRVYAGGRKSFFDDHFSVKRSVYREKIHEEHCARYDSNGS